MLAKLELARQVVRARPKPFHDPLNEEQQIFLNCTQIKSNLKSLINSIIKNDNNNGLIAQVDEEIPYIDELFYEVSKGLAKF